MAMASVVCASQEIEPNDMAPVANRLTILLAGSTFSNGTDGLPCFNLNKPLRFLSLWLWLLICALNFLNPR